MSLYRLFQLLLVFQLFGSGQLNAHSEAKPVSFPVHYQHHVLSGFSSAEDDEDHILHPVSTHIDKAFEVFIENTEESGGEPVFVKKDFGGKEFVSHVFYALPYGNESHSNSSFTAFRTHATPVPVCRRYVFLQVFRI